jgi:dolichol-phosphate mannosyltransferase
MSARRRLPPPQPLELSVVVPTRNESGNVPFLVQRLRSALAEISFEIVVVDDSDDSTPRLLRELASKDGRLQIIHRQPGQRAGGLSTAVVRGLSKARGRLICVMDGDLQHPPEAIPGLLAAEAAGADVVVASRYLPGASRSGLGGGFRRLVSKAATLLAQAVFAEARSSTDPLAGFFLCRSSLLQGLEFRPVGFKILLELLICSEGATVVDVPLAFQARGAGESKASAAQGWLYLRHLWSLARDVPGSARRWKFAAVGLSGLIILLGGLELFAVVLGWLPIAAWAVGFAASLAWNFILNLHITFADARRERYPLMRRYISTALTAGLVQLLVFLALASSSTGQPLVRDGLLAALVGMAVNAILAMGLVRARRAYSPEPIGLEPTLLRLAKATRAELAVLVDGLQNPVIIRPDGPYRMTAPVRELCKRAGTRGMPVLWTEPPSSRPQARTNVEMHSAIVLPFAAQNTAGDKIVLLRHSRTAFDAADLEAAMRQLHRLGRFPSGTAPGRVKPRPAPVAQRPATP